ncbi:Uncharacterised protein [Enterobacter cloacae]|nr:Uncharacterised protein [Enterobacter cloacae]
MNSRINRPTIVAVIITVRVMLVRPSTTTRVLSSAFAAVLLKFSAADPNARLSGGVTLLAC